MAGVRDGILWLRGFVDLRAKGRRPVAFLNALLEQDVRFRGARWDDGELHLRIPLADFRHVRPAARASGVSVRIRGRAGGPFVAARLRRRPALLAAALVAAVGLYALSGSIWFVQVQGLDRVGLSEVAAAAESLGLRPGARKAALNPAEIARRLPLAVPELSWAAVTFHGVLATIQVVERIRPAPAYEQASLPGDVVAAHAGVVTAIQVSAGEAEVRPGQHVSAGQVLIRGQAVMPVGRTRQSGVEGMRTVRVHASGIVLAVGRHQTYAEAPREVVVGVPTGRTFVRRELLLGRWRLDLQGWRPVPFVHYELTRHGTGRMRWRNVALPVELLTYRYAEVAPHVRLLSVEAARDAAAADARAFLRAQLPAKARIVQETQRTMSLPGSRVGVELSVETEDNIGVFRPDAPPPPAVAG